jgi:hypothetical protein
MLVAARYHYICGVVSTSASRGSVGIMLIENRSTWQIIALVVRDFSNSSKRGSSSISMLFPKSRDLAG